MATISHFKASDGHYLYDGDSTFVREISTYGDPARWQEVTEEFKASWDAAHPVESPEGLAPDEQ